MQKNHQFSLRLGVLAVSFLLLILVLPAAAQDGEWPRALVDGLGTEVTIAAPPQRIASVSLASDEVLLSLVEPERIAAVTAFGQDPAISNVAVAAQAIEKYRLHDVTAGTSGNAGGES